ncbi:MAG TPA: ABC transporter permease [Chitinophagaceae bacterium]|nr:ABC transporter permease [Chitinophagaceae bacterium]
MLKNYFKIAWHNIGRNKVSSFINIAGLAIGITCVIFILFYVQDELRYDKFIKNAGRIYQVNIEGNMGGQEYLSGTTPPPAGAALTNTFPEIETYTRFFNASDEIVRSEKNKQVENYFTESNVHGVDSNFLQVFNYKMLQGDARTCLLQANSVVITEQIAKKYFGNSPDNYRDAIGRVLLFDDDRKPFTVTAVLQNLPSHSSLQFDMLRPMISYPLVKRFSWSWVWTQMATYVKLRDNVPNDAAAMQKLESKFPAMVKTQAADAFIRIGQPLDELEKKGGKYILRLQPLTAIHLHSVNVGSNLTTLSDIKYVYIFSVIAFFIIILACVNFMNLSTAQSAKRAKEVGIRKVLGSVKAQLIKQFYTEAFIYTLIATVIALLLVLVLMKSFDQLSGKELSFGLLFSNNNLIYLVVVIVITGLLAGSYPSFYLTSFKPVEVLKGKLLKTSFGNLFLRNGLVIFQFTISTALIVCTIIMFQQLQYTRSKNMGLNKDNVIVVANTNRLGTGEETFRQQVSGLPGIKSTSISTSVPTKYLFADGYVPVQNTNEQIAKDITLTSFIVDYDFVSTLQLQLLKGRNFSKDFSDSTSVILNEAAVRQIGWKEPLGGYIEYPGGNNQKFKVIGIVKNFNFQSLHNTILPFALFHSSSKTYDIGSSFIVARIEPGETNNVINKLESKWKSFAAATPFDYSFLDEEFNALYQSDKRMGSVFGLFTMLSIFVACLGLFGLATYTAERRTKEIGIRKVLGASVQSVVRLLSKYFLKLVFIAAIIACPVAWWAMNKWLEDFAYRINISWGAFVAAGVAVLLIALITVSFKAIKAAIANPIKSLRTE